MSVADRAAACPHCARAAAVPRTGRYHLDCVGCCARLIRSARPWREAQEGMFSVIARQPGRPAKVEIIEAIKAIDNVTKG